MTGKIVRGFLQNPVTRFNPAEQQFLVSGAKEHKPDHAKDQYRKPSRNREQREYGRPRLGLAGFGRALDDLILPSRRHGDLNSCMRRETIGCSRRRV